MENNNATQKPLSLASMICGIAPFATFLIPFLAWLAIPSAIVAIVLSVIAKNREPKNGMRTAGLVLGIVYLSLWLVLIIFGIILGAAILGSLGAF